jgi:hypothetical protein
MKSVIPIAEIKAREADPSVAIGAQARMDQFNARAMPHKARMEALGTVAIRARSPAAKVRALREMLDIVAMAAGGLAACGKGCSACCHIAVMVPAEEAAVIAKEIGVKALPPKRFSKHGDDSADQYYGEPCPFLSNGECSIYESRPLSCRTLYNMDADPLLCIVVPGNPPQVPYLNHWPFTMVIARAFIESMHSYADLREFFPNGKGRKP